MAAADRGALAGPAPALRSPADRLRAFARWEADGTWARLLEHVQVRDDAVGQAAWTASVDSTINRAHQHAAGARKRRRHAGTNRKIRHLRRIARRWGGPGAG